MSYLFSKSLQLHYVQDSLILVFMLNPELILPHINNPNILGQIFIVYDYNGRQYFLFIPNV